MGIAKVSIQTLRTFVKNGWTIANRRAITSQIGKSNFDEIANLARKQGIDGDIFEYQFTKDFLKPNELISSKNTLLGIDSRWGRKINYGNGNWNEEYYAEYRPLCTTGKDIKNPSKLSEKGILKRKIFDKCKTLGCDEIQYRGEIYHKNSPHYKKLIELKQGDIYKPNAEMWTSNTSEYAWGSYGSSLNPNCKNVHYEILCPDKSKIIQFPYTSIGSEGILSPDNAYKVISSQIEDGILKLRLEIIV
jgi:hypothetical protein